MSDYKIQNPLYEWKKKLETVTKKNYTGHEVVIVKQYENKNDKK